MAIDLEELLHVQLGKPAFEIKQKLHKSVVVYDIFTAESAVRANNELRKMLTLHDVKSITVVWFEILLHSP